MALSYAFRQAVKNRKRRWRRVEVLLFFGFMANGLVEGGHALTWNNVGSLWLPYFFAIMQIFFRWRQQRLLPVSSLDDRAMVEYGVEFERLGEPQQKELLKRYRVGTYLLNYFPDEYEHARELDWHMRAYAVLRWLLPAMVMIYWAGWRLLPEGGVRAAWTNGPVVLFWVFLLVLALPQILQMWMEPDEVEEPRVVTMEREA